MWHLYLDESGDLGFDFVNKKPSKFFTVCILAVSSTEVNKKLLKAAQLTLRRKINKKRKTVMHNELKATKTTHEIKQYFFSLIRDLHFGIYAVTLNKKKLFEKLSQNKSRVYNYIAKLVLEQIPFERNDGERVTFVLDRSMSKPEVNEFNIYIRHHLEGRLPPSIPLDIEHRSSQEHFGIQIADLFSWGIYQKYEHSDLKLYDVFKEKIRFEKPFL